MIRLKAGKQCMKSTEKEYIKAEMDVRYGDVQQNCKYSYLQA